MKRARMELLGLLCEQFIRNQELLAEIDKLRDYSTRNEVKLIEAEEEIKEKVRTIADLMDQLEDADRKLEAVK